MFRSLVGAVLLILGAQGAALAQNGEADYAVLRSQMVGLVKIQVMVSSQSTGISELDPEVVAALEEVPRHAFVPSPLRPFAYADRPLPVGHDQNISSPFLIALMTQLIDPKPGDKVYETGTGAGYHAAVLSRLVAQVYSVEVIQPLAEAAAERLRQLGYGNVSVHHGDGYYGWTDHAPYDAILVKEAVDHIPVPLLGQ